MKPPIHKFKAKDVWRRHESGWDARFYFWDYGLGEKCDAFTMIETVVGDQYYIQRHGRAYHKRWLWRLANEFAWRVNEHRHNRRPPEPTDA